MLPRTMYPSVEGIIKLAIKKVKHVRIDVRICSMLKAMHWVTTRILECSEKYPSDRWLYLGLGWSEWLERQCYRQRMSFSFLTILALMGLYMFVNGKIQNGYQNKRRSSHNCLIILMGTEFIRNEYNYLAAFWAVFHGNYGSGRTDKRRGINWYWGLHFSE